MKDVKNVRQTEEIKREYFKLNVNSRLDSQFTLHTEEEKEQFIDICKYVGSVMSLGQIFKSQSQTTKALCHMKHIFYLVYMVCFPIQAKVTILPFFFVAILFSAAQRKLSMKTAKDSFVHIVLSDEEIMHFIWFLTYLLLGWQIKIVVDGMFLCWAFLNTIEWLDYLHNKYPSIPIIGLFQSLILLI